MSVSSTLPLLSLANKAGHHTDDVGERHPMISRIRAAAIAGVFGLAATIGGAAPAFAVVPAKATPSKPTGVTVSKSTVVVCTTAEGRKLSATVAPTGLSKAKLGKQWRVTPFTSTVRAAAALKGWEAVSNTSIITQITNPRVLGANNAGRPFTFYAPAKSQITLLYMDKNGVLQHCTAQATLL